jgi:hypothetical protein
MPQAMDGKLSAENFALIGPDVQTLSDTPIVVTLDELRPYELNPRLKRNPLYDEIKASIKERGLDAPPPITRRPGADHYIIRNGDNTRLVILRELWSETKEECFFRIACQFRPWPERGEALKQPALVALLVNARVPWCTVQVNQETLRRLISQANNVTQEINTVDRMLRLGASTEMISRYHGLTHQEIALRREIIGLPGRKGRHLALGEEQETELWQAWKAAVTERGVVLDDEMAMLALAMDLAEALAVSLAVVWAALQNWIAQGLTGE